MKEHYAVYLQGIPNFRVFAGLSCVFLVSIPNPQKKSKVDHTILSKIRRTELSNTSSKAYSTFVNAFDNLSEADDTVKWIQALDGVESVKMGVMKELIVVQDWLRDEVEKKMSLAL